MAPRLRSDLQEQFHIPDDPGAGLGQIFELARGANDADVQNLLQFLFERYWNTDPPHWFRKTTEIPWFRIWSLNIDDVVEKAYANNISSSVQSLIATSWNHPHIDPAPGELVLVHLHGRANTREIDDLIFDLPSYNARVRGPQLWHQVFESDYASRPTIVAGAQLQGEADLHEIIKRGRVDDPNDSPSLIVKPSFSEFELMLYKRNGLIPISSTFEEFVSRLHGEIHERLHQLRPTPDLSRDADRRLLAFRDQWTELRVPPPKPGEVDDFFDGREPTLAQIGAGAPAKRDIVPAIVDQILGVGALSSSAVVIMGDHVSGKTVIQLMVGRLAIRDQWHVFKFEPDRKPDTASVLWWLRRAPKTLLLVEDVAPFAQSFRILLDEAREAKLRVHLLGTARTSSERDVERSLAALPEYVRFDLERLSDQEVESVLERLTHFKRLGTLQNLPPQGRINHFVTKHRRSLFDGLASVEEGPGFLRRAQKHYQSLGDGKVQHLYIAISVAGAMGIGLPFPVAAKSAGLSIAEANRAYRDNEALFDLVRLDRGQLYPRQKRLSGLVVKNLSNDLLFDVTADLAVALAPLQGRSAITAKTREYRIVRQLMDRRVIGGFIGHQRRAEWYEQLLEHYGEWNARFWEQRALVASDESEFPRAMSWASTALDMHRDAFTLNTWATIALKSVVSGLSVESQDEDLFYRALNVLKEAQERAPLDSEHPYVTFFRYVLRYAGLIKDEGRTLPPRLVAMWDEWWYLAEASPALKGRAASEDLRTWQRSWLMLATR